MKKISAIALLLVVAGTTLAAGEAVVKPGQNLTNDQAASLKGEDALNVTQLQAHDMLNWDNPRVAARADVSQIVDAPRTIDKRNFRKMNLKDAVPGRVAVAFRPGTTLAEQAAVHAKLGMTEKWRARVVANLCRVERDGADLAAVVNAYLDEPSVMFAHPINKAYADIVPNDSSYSSQWSMAASNGGCAAELAWEEFRGSPAATIAVVDSGVSITHVDLQQNVWTNPGEVLNGLDDDGNGYVDDVQGWDFVDNNNNPAGCLDHGTHVAGTIGARGNNGLGVAGVNWTASIMALRCDYDCDGTFWGDQYDGLDYAIDNGARVSNHSYGGEGQDPTWTSIAVAGQAFGHIAVCSAGNDSTNIDATPYAPAGSSASNVLSVGSLDEGGSVSDFSNYGATQVDLFAPGGGIYSTVNTTGYENKSGTSMAAPHVAGAVGLVLAKRPNLTWQQAKDLILNSTTPSTALAGKCVTGGRLNVHRALGVWAQGAPGGTNTGGRMNPIYNFFPAWNYTPSGGVLNMVTGVYSRGPATVLNRPMTLRAEATAGSVVIGQ
jgi:subtilisin family serine protease